MRYYRIEGGVIAQRGEEAYDLSSTRARIESFRELARTAEITGESIDSVVEGLFSEASLVDPETIDAAAKLPVEFDEIWAAGVTYKISEEARMAESGMPDMYLDVYDAERPEVFFKATADRTVGPGEPVGIRADSDWDVPEPELGVVLHRGSIVGYTIGNDMSSRSIEGANPLYLPQAKVYDRCCAIGPCISSAEEVGDPHDLEMWMRIERGDDTVYSESTNTSQMARTCEELVSYNLRHNTVPEHSILLTGTSLVPEEDFTLAVGDEVHIGIESIGTLVNPVIEV